MAKQRFVTLYDENSDIFIKNTKRFACLFFGVLLSVKVISLPDPWIIPEPVMQQVKAEYGDQAIARITRWQEMMVANLTLTDLEKLEAVNNFANNEVRYASDLEHWGVLDYWATPIETLQTGAGDCEDYAILKYFSLRAMGVAESKMRLMYVRALEFDEPHMVLIYIAKPGEYPLVLDNIKPEIVTANLRPDLRPVYSFNTEGLWMARAQGIGNKVEHSAGVSQWQQLIHRIETQSAATR